MGASGSRRQVLIGVLASLAVPGAARAQQAPATDPLAKLRDLYEARHPLYLEAAHVTFETSRPSMNYLVNQIHKHLELSGVL